MKNKLSLLLILSIFVFALSCKDDNGLRPPKVKDMVVSDLQNTVWNVVSAGVNINGSGYQHQSSTNAYIKSVSFIGGVVEVEYGTGKKAGYGYDVSNVNNVDQLPNILVLNVKSNDVYFYLYLPKDYSGLNITLKSPENTNIYFNGNYQRR